jgi:hypothetical protein
MAFGRGNEHEVSQWRGKQAITVAQPYEPLQHKPTLEVERILAVDIAATRAQAKGVIPTISHEGG